MESLSDEQKIIFNKYLNKENIFITGPGGTGKSYLIKIITKHAEENKKKIKVCALTGCAAILLKCKATTLHSFAGIGLANKPIDEVVRYVLDNKNKAKNWKNIDILIIDEVSMLSLKLLLILDSIAKKIYNNDKPFGGIQVIFTGDFYQLPPVNTNDQDKEASMFCFEHKLWYQIFPKENQIKLKSIFRQNNKAFIKALNYIRRGIITKSTLSLLESRIRTSEEIDAIKKEKILTILSPIKKDVENINKYSFENLITEQVYNYKIKYVETTTNTKNDSNDIVNAVTNLSDDFEKLFQKSAPFTKFEYDFLINNIMAEKEISLKIGTYVMCIANIDLQSEYQIANGSQGKVVGFRNNLPLVKFNNIPHAVLVNYYTCHACICIFI